MLQSGLQRKGREILLEDSVRTSCQGTAHSPRKSRVCINTCTSPPKHTDKDAAPLRSSEVLSHIVPRTCHHHSLCLTAWQDDRSQPRFTLLEAAAAAEFSVTPPAMEEPWRMFADTKQSHVVPNPQLSLHLPWKKPQSDFRRLTKVPVTVPYQLRSATR